MWRGPESGLPRGPRWLSAGLLKCSLFRILALWCLLCIVESDLSEADLDDVDIRQQYDGKIGTKKLRKLEEKAARKAQREVCNHVLYLVMMLQGLPP